MKRRSDRRYYQLHEGLMIRRLGALLYDYGCAITGITHQLAGGSASVATHGAFDEKQFLTHASCSKVCALKSAAKKKTLCLFQKAFR